MREGPGRTAGGWRLIDRRVPMRGGPSAAEGDLVAVPGGRETVDELKEIDKEVRRIVNEAAEFAQADPEPDPAELWTDVYR